MADKTTTSFDDYYAHIPTPSTTEEDTSKKKSLKLKVKVKKVEEISLSITPIIDETPKKAEKIKEKKSTVAIIWSPEAEKVKESVPEKVSVTEGPKAATPKPSVFTPRDNIKKKPFIPRYTSHQNEKTTPVTKPVATTPTPFVFTPKSSE